MSETVLIELIRLEDDGGISTQMREETDWETVNRYAEDMDRGDRFPLMDLVEDGGGAYLVADGWHRILAHRQLGWGTVDAIVHSVPEGEDPVDVAVKRALRANRTHGLHFKAGDQRRKAKAALLHPAYQGWKFRALGAEIGVGKSTIGRVRADLIREGILVHPMTGGKMPEWMPDNHASLHGLSDPFEGDQELVEAVYRYIAQLTSAIDSKAWQWVGDEDGGGHVHHSGLIEGKTVSFEIEDNPIEGGLPSKYDEVPEDDSDGPTWDREEPSLEEQNRIEAARARREFNAAAKRIKARGDPELTQAVDTLMKRADEPGLGDDLRTLINTLGPDTEHRHEDF